MYAAGLAFSQKHGVCCARA